MFAVRKSCLKVNFVVWGTTVYHKADYPMHDHRYHFVATRNTRASSAVGELALAISH